MKGINLLWIVPLCTIFGWFLALNFVNADIDITMDNNTRIAVESFNQSIQRVADFDCLNEEVELVFNCMDTIERIKEKEYTCDNMDSFTLCIDACSWDGDNNHIMDNPDAMSCISWCEEKFNQKMNVIEINGDS